MNLPATNNVYGQFRTTEKLEKLAELLRRNYSDSLVELEVIKSDYDGSQTLNMDSDALEFETRMLEKGGYGFNGAVAGNEEQVRIVVEEIHSILKRYGYEPTFEVYDEEFNFIYEIKA